MRTGHQMTALWDQVIRPFLTAQYNFLSSYDYGKGRDGQQMPPDVHYERWGSRYRRENNPRQQTWINESGDGRYLENRPRYGNGGGQGGRPGRWTGRNQEGYRMDQQRKRVRFSDWVKADKIHQDEKDRDQLHGQSRRISPIIEGSRDSFLREAGKETTVIGKGGVKRMPDGEPKEKGRTVVELEPIQITPEVHTTPGRDLFQQMPTRGQTKN